MSRIFRRKGRRGWWLDYIDTNGERIRRSAGTTDKTTALLALAAAETSEVRKTIGVIHQDDLETKEQSKRPISEHFDEFIQFLRVSGRSENHLSGTRSHSDVRVATGVEAKRSNCNIAYYGRRLEGA